MGQVRLLVEDREVSPVAPIVLAGAALEMALRLAVTDLGLSEEVPKPSIAALARLLRTKQVISVQQMKDIDQMTGVRNAAAHGQVEDLSAERAGLMEQQVNLFLAQLATQVATLSGG